MAMFGFQVPDETPGPARLTDSEKIEKLAALCRRMLESLDSDAEDIWGEYPGTGEAWKKRNEDYKAELKELGGAK